MGEYVGQAESKRKEELNERGDEGGKFRLEGSWKCSGSGKQEGYG